MADTLNLSMDATMTPDQEAVVLRGVCFKCVAPTVTDVDAPDFEGCKWMHCSRCRTVFAVTAGVKVEGGGHA